MILPIHAADGQIHAFALRDAELRRDNHELVHGSGEVPAIPPGIPQNGQNGYDAVEYICDIDAVHPHRPDQQGGKAHDADHTVQKRQAVDHAVLARYLSVANEVHTDDAEGLVALQLLAKKLDTIPLTAPTAARMIWISKRRNISRDRIFVFAVDVSMNSPSSGRSWAPAFFARIMVAPALPVVTGSAHTVANDGSISNKS